MKKIVPAIFGILIILIIWVYFTNDIISPQSKVPTSTTYTNATIKTSPIKNEDGSLTYNNVNSNVYTSMKRILLRAGFKVPNENEGDIYIYGTKIHSKWDNVTNLTITIKDKPWYIPYGLITDKITDFVNKCGGS
jgi:hypothetical protein